LNSIDDVLARARAALQNSPTNSSPFKVMPAPVPGPVPRPGQRNAPRIPKELRVDSRAADKFVVRMPDDLRARMARFANQHRRSCNSECVEAMYWWLDRQELMWLMLQGIERELARQEVLRQGEELKALDDIAQRQPETAALIKQLKAMISLG
jgi:predicted transcriptional regulator